MITQARLKQLLHYDPQLGWFMWLVDRGSRASAGSIIGTVSAKGYLSVEIDGHSYWLHSLAWLYVKGVLPPQLDHRDTRGDNNRLRNLRLCNTQQNCAGRRLRRDSLTGFKGVSQVAPGVWRARIRVHYEGLHLGRFPSPVDAARAYDRAAVTHFGAFARTNKMLGLL